VKVLRALVEHHADRPNVLPTFDDDRSRRGLLAGSDEARREAVAYVAGMTDRFAFNQAVSLLGWDAAALPQGIR
jgi:dGTPase